LVPLDLAVEAVRRSEARPPVDPRPPKAVALDGAERPPWLLAATAPPVKANTNARVAATLA